MTRFKVSVFLPFVSAACAFGQGMVASESVLYRQLPVFPGSGGASSVLFSDGITSRWADDFQLGRDAMVGSVVWWGTHTSQSTLDDFSLTLYSDSGGQPGAIIPGFILSQVRREDGLSQTGGEVEYLGVLKQPFEIRAGTRYWLSLTHPPLRSFDWTGSAPRGNAANQNGGGAWILQPETSASFALSVDVHEPSTLALVGLGIAVGLSRMGWRSHIQSTHHRP